MLEAEITSTGDVLVEGQHVGQLQGFRFAPDAAAEGADGKALRAAAQKALASEMGSRAEKLSRAPNEEFALADDGALRWQGEMVARLLPGDTVLAPGILFLCDDTLDSADREKVEARLQLWVKAHVDTLVKPLRDLETGEGLEGLARGVAFRLVENLGIVERADISEDVRQLDQTMRAGLRRLGVRFGAHHIFVPALLKPAPSRLIAQLWALKHGEPDMPGLAELPQLSASGRTSIMVDPEISKALYKVVGFRVCGPRAVRIDILERLADLIRPLLAWKPLDAGVTPPEGAVAEGGGFTVTVAMTSLLGCAGEDFSAVLKSLGYRSESREVQRPVVAGVAEVAAEAPAETAPETENAGDVAPAPVEAETASATDAAPEAEAVPVSEPEAVAADEVAPETETEAPAAEAVVAETVVPEAESAEPETTEAVAAESADEVAPSVVMETVTIEVWRPGRRERRGRGGDEAAAGRREGRRGGRGRSGEGAADRRPGGKPKGKGRSFADGGKRRDGAGGGKPGASHKSAPAPRKQALDPDSPFAKLAALKADLEKKPRDKT